MSEKWKQFIFPPFDFIVLTIQEDLIKLKNNKQTNKREVLGELIRNLVKLLETT